MLSDHDHGEKFMILKWVIWCVTLRMVVATSLKDNQVKQSDSPPDFIFCTGNGDLDFV